MKDYDIYSIEDFKKYIPDLDKFVLFTKEVFDAGGILAGGCLTKAIQNKGIIDLFDVNYRVGGYRDGPHYEAAASWAPPHSTGCYTDADFYFLNSNSYINYIEINRQYLGSFYGIENYILMVKNNPTNFNTQRMVLTNAKQYSGDLYVLLNLVNMGNPNISKIEDILDSFDFTNCRIATDGKNVYIHKDTLKYELSNTLHINHISNAISSTSSERTRLKKCFERIEKYLKNPHYLHLVDDKKNVYKLLFEFVNSFPSERRKYVIGDIAYWFTIPGLLSPQELVVLLSQRLELLAGAMEARKDFKINKTTRVCRNIIELTDGSLFDNVKHIPLL